MERLYIDCTGGLSEVERTASGNMVKERTNLEKDGNGYLVRRSEPVDYDTDLNTALATFTSITKISDLVYSGYMPANTTFWFLAFGKVSAVNRLYIITENEDSYSNTPLTDDLADLGITSLSDNLRFFVSADRILVCDGEHQNFYVKISQDLDIVVSLLGLPSPKKKLFVADESFISSESTISTGISVERGQILKLAYTYITKDGVESNPSPITIYDENQLQYYNPTKDIGFDYFLESLTIAGFELPSNLGTETLENIDAFRLYMAESKYNEDVQGFNNFALIQEFSLISAKSGNQYTFTTSKVKSGTQITYGNDVSPASNDISEIGGVVGLFGLKSDLREKFPYSFDKYFRINISNPNGVNYINRPFMLSLNEEYTVFDEIDFSSYLTTNTNKIRFYEDDLITPIKTQYIYVSNAESETDNKVTNFNVTSNIAWSSSGSGWVYNGSGWNVIPGATGISTLTSNEDYTFVNTFANVSCSFYSPINTGTFKIVLYDGTDKIDSDIFSVHEGVNNIDYTFSGVDTAEDYVIQLVVTAGTEIKDMYFVGLYDVVPTDNVLFFLKIPEIQASSSKSIYLCLGGTGVTDDFAKTFEYGMPKMVVNGNQRDSDNIFTKNMIRNSSEKVVSDCYFRNGLGYTVADERIPNLVSDSYMIIEEVDGDIGYGYITPIAKERIYNNLLFFRSNKDAYVTFGSNAKLDTKNFVWGEISSPVITTTGFIKFDPADMTDSVLYVIWQSGTVSTEDGIYFYIVKDSGNIIFRTRVYDGGTYTYYDLATYTTSSAETYFYVLSLDFTNQNDNNTIHFWLFDEEGNKIDSSYIENVRDVSLYDESAWSINGVGSFVGLNGLALDQPAVYLGLKADSLDKAKHLFPSKPYFNIEQIGWFEEQTSYLSCTIDTATADNKIIILGEDLTNILEDYDVDYRKNSFLFLKMDNSVLSGFNGYYHIGRFVLNGSNSELSVTEILPSAITGEKADIYIYKPNKNIDFEELTTNKLVTQRNNYMQWSNINSDSFPDTFIKRLRDVPIRGIKAPSFLRFEYQNTFIIFYKHGVDRFVFNDSLDNLATSINNVIPELSNLGLYFADSVVETANALYWISADGVVEWSSNGIKMISELRKQSSHTKLIEIDYTTGDYMGVYIPSKNQIMFIDRTNASSLVYDIDEKEWMRFSNITINWGVTTKETDSINFMVDGDDIKKYPSSTDTTENTVLTKEYETYYALFGGYTLDISGDPNVTAKCYNSKFALGQLSKIYLDVDTEKRYGLPAGFYGNKLSITISNADIIKPFTIDLSQRRSRR